MQIRHARLAILLVGMPLAACGGGGGASSTSTPEHGATAIRSPTTGSTGTAASTGASGRVLPACAVVTITDASRVLGGKPAKRPSGTPTSCAYARGTKIIGVTAMRATAENARAMRQLAKAPGRGAKVLTGTGYLAVVQVSIPPNPDSGAQDRVTLIKQPMLVQIIATDTGVRARSLKRAVTRLARVALRRL